MQFVDPPMAARDWGECGFLTGTRHPPGVQEFRTQRPTGSYGALTAVLTWRPRCKVRRSTHRSE